MLTLRTATALLERTDGFAALPPLATALGFTGPQLRLTPTLRRDLGLAPWIARAAVIEGHGPRRCLLATLPAPTAAPIDARATLRHLATALLRHAPACLWSLLLLDPAQGTLLIACATETPAGPAIATLHVDRAHVRSSDADTLCALTGITETDPPLQHARWQDILQRDALSSQFYRALEQSIHRMAAALAPNRRYAHRARRAPTDAERREIALLCASRLLFLAFLETKGWLDHRRDFLLHHTLRQLQQGGELHRRLLRPLFFGTLNTPTRHRAPRARTFGAVPFLNGGLFAPTALERRWEQWDIGDDALEPFVSHLLDRYRFTVREDSTGWSEVAIDPEMLGRAFEGLMAPTDRHRSGSFYTPTHLVRIIVQDALHSACPTLPDVWSFTHTASRPVPPDRAAHLQRELRALSILDPACGSGACLVAMLEAIDAALAACGDPEPSHTRRRAILARSIFGVDKEPLAVWLCELRLWLAIVICHPEQEHQRIPPLPNLDHHIRIGDALSGGTLTPATRGASHLTRLRERYARASGPRKRTVARALDQEERTRATTNLTLRLNTLREERRALLTTLRGHDLFGQRRHPTRSELSHARQLRTDARALAQQRRRLQLGAALPFRFSTMFADVVARGGFSLIIGNPPWVRPHALPAADRAHHRQEFLSMRHAAWRRGATRAGATTGFAAQADLAAAFIERSVQLLAPSGVLALLVPAKLWRTLAGGGVRRLLRQQTRLLRLRDWSDGPSPFEAATYPSLLVARRAEPPQHTPPATATVEIEVARRATPRTTRIGHLPLHQLALTNDDDAPWLLLPPDARQAFDRLQRSGPALGDSPLGRPRLGVKCGCNAAFLVHAEEHGEAHATIASLTPTSERRGIIERQLLRPALRGDMIGRQTNDRPSGEASHPTHDLRLIWTHGVDGAPLRLIPPATSRWLAHWQPQLRARRDARPQQPWWTLFRTEAANHDRPRLVWADIGRRLRCQILPAGDPTVPLNSCYVLHLPTLADAYTLLALLQSDITAAWLDPLAEPARGGFRRFLGWTVASLPIPTAWAQAVHQLAPLGAALHQGEALPPNQLEDAVAHAYGVPLRLLHPLLDWYRHD